MAHLSGGDDIPFTMELKQQGETVTGTITAQDGELEIKSGTFKANLLDLHLEMSDSQYSVSGKLQGGQFKGHWAKDPEGMEGEWEGKRSTPAQLSGQ